MAEKRCAWQLLSGRLENIPEPRTENRKTYIQLTINKSMKKYPEITNIKQVHMGGFGNYGRENDITTL